MNMKLCTAAIAAFGLLIGSVNAALIITDNGTTAPTGAIVQNADNNSNTRVNDDTAQAGRARIRGQSFTTGPAIDVDAVTLQMAIADAGAAVPAADTHSMRLSIWEIGSSVAPSDGTVLLDDTGDFPLNMDAGDYFTLSLPSVVSMNAGTEYGFSIEWATNLGTDIKPAVSTGDTFADGTLLFNNPAGNSEVNASNSTQDMTFYLHGEIIPEPGSMALLTVALLAIARGAFFAKGVL